MKEFLVVLGAVLPVLLTALAGLLMRRVNSLTEEADRSLLDLTINLLIPCFIFDKLLGNRAMQDLSNLLLAPAVGAATVTGGILLCLALAGLSGLKDAGERRSFGFSTGLYNYGYVPLPLALALFDNETVATLVVHNVGVDTAFWVVGALLFHRGDGSIWRKVLRPPVWAIALTVTLNFAGLAGAVPAIVKSTAAMIGACAIPMGLLITGALVADVLKEFHGGGGARVMLAACALRLLVLPVLFLLLAKHLPAGVELKRVIILQAAMPSAVFAILAARFFNGHPAIALRVVLATSLVSFATIPLWIRFGLHFVGLDFE